MKSVKNAKVTVYSTPTCPYCHMAKEFLNSKGVKFEDVDVSANHEAAEEMIKKSGFTGVPQIEIKGKIIVGFDKEELEKELKIYKSPRDFINHRDRVVSAEGR